MKNVLLNALAFLFGLYVLSHVPVWGWTLALGVVLGLLIASVRARRAEQAKETADV